MFELRGYRPVMYNKLLYYTYVLHTTPVTLSFRSRIPYIPSWWELDNHE